MTIILEDGSAKTNSNSYVDLPYADSYFSSHPYYADEWDALSDSVKSNLLIEASQRLDTMFSWVGEIKTDAQAMRWPRNYAYDIDQRLISSSIVPEGVKKACCELALFTSRKDTETPDSSVGVEQIKIDVIELKFNGSTSPAPVPRAAVRLLRGLATLYSSSSVRQVDVR
jgi:hypothetical protein